MPKDKDKDKYKGRPRKAAKTATAKKYGSNKKSVKKLLNQLSINKKPKKNVTNDLDVARLTKYTNTKPKSKPKVTSTGAEKKVKIANPENNSKSISSPSNNTKGQETISNVSRMLQVPGVVSSENIWGGSLKKTAYNAMENLKQARRDYVKYFGGEGKIKVTNNPKKKTKEELKKEWLKKMKNPSYYRGR